MSDFDETPQGLRGFLTRFEPTPGRQRRHYLRNGAITLGVVALGIVLAMTLGYYRDVPFIGGGKQLKARFAHAPNLRVNNPVRVRGIKVGKVTEIRRDDSPSVAIVTMELDSGHDIELKRDARAAVLWRTLLGRNMYVDLDPGSPSAPPLAGDEIPLSRTHAQVEFDQLFEPLDGDGRAAVQTTLREFDRAFRETGPPGRSLDRLAPTMRAVAPTLDAFRGRRTGDLQRLVRSTSTTMRALGRSDRALASLIDGAAITFGVTAARRADLGSFVRQAPQTLSDTRRTTARLRTTLDLLDPVAERLQPGLRRLDDASRAVRPALAQATPLLRDARPLADRLARALTTLRSASGPGVRVMRGLDPTLTRASDELLPWLEQRNDIGLRNGHAIGPTASTLASAAQQYNGFGHQLRFQGLGGGERSIGLPCQTYFVDPASSKRVECERLSKLFKAIAGGSQQQGRKAR